MLETNIDKLLIAKSTPLEEVEDDDIDLLSAEAIEDSIIYDIINVIGTDDFKPTYLSLKNEINNLSEEKKVFFGNEIINRLEEVYSFKFMNNEEILNSDDFSKLISFIRWLEYDNELFACKFFSFLDVEKIFILDINKLLEENWDYIYDRVIKFHSSSGNEYLEYFLRTNSKENIFAFLLRIFRIHRYMIADYLMNKKTL